ncbi:MULTISPECIES: alpha-hydroxy acid oxidase [unclassified Halomonas]|uniref:alpha-hydroxy acid oxidase n=1 Tax=unclassified Halomonas TaxID=2609666 RepID=UPI0006D9DBA5|nr:MULTISPECIES: alpha-hydroxy acid oxidase [unclassified Halomonas]KPQ27953.1 MAG: (S)-mandelate dehydrogenase [Halomonas sp. HL-93]SBR51723.1 L-lactate dehydrogenase (cytochrome) [Halomonas sp. HL-93]SNY97485.1 L-lactate dehydrogenase (cytochrome) [Halomonas sp. hl-4]
MPRRLKHILSLDDFERAARRHLPRPLFGYVASVAEDGATARASREAFDNYVFLPRALVNVSDVSMETELFGQRYAYPFGIAPMGISALTAYRGDKVLARAAADAGIPMIVSGTSLIPMESLAGPDGSDWFQAYLPGTGKEIDALLARVEKAGFSKLVITVDYAVPPNPENHRRAGFSSPLRPSLRLACDGLLRPRWLFGTFLKTLWHHGVPHFENNAATRGVPVLAKNVNRDFSGRRHLDWSTLDRVRARWEGKLIVKGILHPDDARRAVSAGADGVIVSNHGGRQLDATVAPLTMLPEVVEAVDGAVPVMIDGSFRRGSQVLKALSLGASFVFLGRPFNYAASIAGEGGVKKAVMLLGNEIERNMALLGVTSLEGLTSHLLRKN